MNTGFNLFLSSLATEAQNVPVKVEIFDSDLKLVESSWINAAQTHTFEVDPGIYGVRASLASGIAFDETVVVKSNELAYCGMDLHEASPHESHEWAYLTQPIDAPGKRLLSEVRYEGVWMRMWQRDQKGVWKVVPIPINDESQATWNEDGVTYRFRTPTIGFYMIQVGGPGIPWKNVALPSSYEIMMLVRPAMGPIESVHPLDVVVSSDNWQIEALLSLMQRGDILGAQSLVDQSQLAEQFLYNKMQDTNAAAIGGYFLLRVRDLNRLHHWANNLANWFEWMADGPVIHAWQIILDSKRESEQQSQRLNQARERLLEAASRGFPVYTEGLRLLRDGLLYFERRGRGKDTDIIDALDKFGEYLAAADWSVTTTTFTGKRPDAPDARSKQGVPRSKQSLIYVFDVPIPEILRRSDIEAEETLIAELPEGNVQGTFKEEGTLELENGSSYKSLGAVQKSITGDTQGAWHTWRSPGKEQSLEEIVTNLRTLPM